MAYYAYKTVRDLLPPHIIEKQGPSYEGDGNYDGDQWYAAEDYILELKAQRDELLAALKAAANYVDVLGGNSQGYRAAIAKVEGGAA